MSRMMKTLERQGSRMQAQIAWENYHGVNRRGGTRLGCDQMSARETLVVLMGRHLRPSHAFATRARGKRAILRYTGMKEGAGDFGIVRAYA